MTMQQRIELPSLRDWLDNAADLKTSLCSIDAQVPLGALKQGSSLDLDIAKLQGRSVLVATPDQLTTALALIELDGVARRLTLLPPDFPRDQISVVVDKAEIDAVITGGAHDQHIDVPFQAVCRPQVTSPARSRMDRRATEWLMFTSGTTGVPKMVVHSLA